MDNPVPATGAAWLPPKPASVADTDSNLASREVTSACPTSLSLGANKLTSVDSSTGVVKSLMLLTAPS